MRWWKQMFGTRHKVSETPTPEDILLDATLNDLRRVASELQETNRAFAERVEILREPRVVKARRRPRPPREG